MGHGWRFFERDLPNYRDRRIDTSERYQEAKTYCKGIREDSVGRTAPGTATKSEQAAKGRGRGTVGRAMGLMARILTAPVTARKSEQVRAKGRGRGDG
jgi:hypothetical protein